MTIATASEKPSNTPSIGAFDNSYARLPPSFHAAALPDPAVSPRLIHFNDALAAELGLNVAHLDDAAKAAIFSGNVIPEGALPIALAYAGHQFGNFVPQLGDGRAILLGEVIDRSGQRRDIQLKGAGPTHFSRNGDGRAAIGPVLREYLVSEAMAALGVPTTRSLAAVSTGNIVYRETRLPGAVVTRVASSHIRVGTFQFFAARSDIDGLKMLADHVIARHYPKAAEAENPYVALYEQIVAAQAELIAGWMQLGFIHGVMNTDNMAVSGETIDYGPCAFLDEYNPAKVFSSIDRHGRYAFSNQPHIARWNLARLAETLLPFFNDDTDKSVAIAQSVLGTFLPQFEDAFLAGMRPKLGLTTAREEDKALVRGLLETMAASGVDFTLTFRSLANDVGLALDELDKGETRKLFIDHQAFDGWARLWLERLALEPSLPDGTQGVDERDQPEIYPAQPSGRGTHRRRRRKRRLRAVPRDAGGRDAPLRRAAGHGTLRRAARAGTTRPPDILRDLKDENGSRRRFPEDPVPSVRDRRHRSAGQGAARAVSGRRARLPLAGRLRCRPDARPGLQARCHEAEGVAPHRAAGSRRRRIRHGTGACGQASRAERGSAGRSDPAGEARRPDGRGRQQGRWRGQPSALVWSKRGAVPNELKFGHIVCRRRTPPTTRTYHPWRGVVPLDGSLSKYHGIAFWLRKSPEAEAYAQTMHDWQSNWPLINNRFRTAPGMFSHDRIDDGSALLAQHLPADLSGAAADFCAGWGYLSAELLDRCPKIASLDLFEADHASLEAARLNLADARVPTKFHWQDLAAEPVARAYDAIVMNPPFHQGKAADPAIGNAMIRAASAAMKPNGRLWMVANRGLPYEPALAAGFKQSGELLRDGKFKLLWAKR